MFWKIFSEEETVRENTEECRLREKIRSLEIEMKELIELHSLEFQVIKEQLKEEEQQRKSRQRNHVIKMYGYLNLESPSNKSYPVSRYTQPDLPFFKLASH